MHILPAGALSDTAYATVDVLLHSQTARARQVNVLVFRYQGRVFAYVNHCMHMHRPLNCQEDAVFDPDHRWLRCSMHGFIFEPDTGICRSPVCEGQALQAVKVAEENGLIVFKEKQLQVLAVHPAKAASGQKHD